MIKKILIVAPFVDFGGREVYINQIAKFLSRNYKVHVLSTFAATENSMSFENLPKDDCHILDKEILKGNKVLFLLSLLSKLKNSRKKKPTHFFLENSLSKKKFDLRHLRLEMLNHFIKDSSIIIIPTIFNEPFISESVDLVFRNKKKVVIIPVSKFKNDLPRLIKDKLEKIFFIHLSVSNANNFLKYHQHNFTIIDQTTIYEKELLNIPYLNRGKRLNYGFLGRLEDGKNIISLLDFFSKEKHKLIIAGDGKKLDSVLNFSNYFDNI